MVKQIKELEEVKQWIVLRKSRGCEGVILGSDLEFK